MKTLFPNPLINNTEIANGFGYLQEHARNCRIKDLDGIFTNGGGMNMIHPKNLFIAIITLIAVASFAAIRLEIHGPNVLFYVFISSVGGVFLLNNVPVAAGFSKSIKGWKNE